MAESKAVYIGKLVFEDYHSFMGRNELNLMDKDGHLYQWTVFLGNNNTGKTNILKAIADLEPVNASKYIQKIPDNIPLGVIRKYISPYYELGNVGLAKPTHYIGCDFYIEPTTSNDNVYEKKLKLLIDNEIWEYGAFRSPPVDSAYGTHKDYDQYQAANYFIEISSGEIDIIGYGITRRTSNNGIVEKNEELNAANLFNPEHKLTNIDEWLFQLKFASQNDRPEAGERLELLKEIIRSEILPEIQDFRFTTTEELKNYIEYQTKEGWFLFDQLGYGYQATMAWIIDLCKKMFERYPGSPNPLKEPAIVLVDELDLHLHPKWQKTIVSYLSKTFPATQFIVTTHSPLILQTIEKINLFALIKTEDRVNIRHIPNQTLEGWSVEEILTDVMEMEDEVYSEKYYELYKDFDAALDGEDYEAAKAAYDKLLEILHPTSPERKILKLQLSQIAPVNDKA